MSVLADFYIADKQSAAAYDDAQECAEDDRVQSKRITPIELSMLAAILEQREWDVDMMDQFAQVLIVDGGERLIHEVSPALVDRLASLRPDEAQRAAEAWARTEEIACAPDEIRPLLDDLMGLAARARATNRQLFLWNCV
jgi:hypothetical protein